jgi:hypothetical protein
VQYADLGITHSDQRRATATLEPNDRRSGPLAGGKTEVSQMIARIWHGAVPVAKSDVYLDRMRSVALPDYKSTSGNRGAYCLHRVEGDLAHFEMLTFWEDVDAIKRFAGNDYQIPKYYDFDRSFLVELEPYVRHYTVYDE